LFLAKLDHIRNYEIRQGNVLLEVVTMGIWPNTYIISDRDYSVNVANASKPTVVSQPVFIVKEDSSCCCRAFCKGNQPLLARVYHAADGVDAGKNACGCYSGHQYRVNHAAGPIMTLEREGCCSKWLGCLICGTKCQNDMYMHIGEFNGPIGVTKEGGNYFGRSVVPKEGAWFTPTLNLATAQPGVGEQPFGVVEGPYCFAGWKGLCCGDVFQISSRPGKSGDLGKINKRPPIGCWETCLALCTDIDLYEFSFTEQYKTLQPEQKAVMLGSIMHLDYLFFENDAPPIMVRATEDGKGLCIICTLWECYCKGCVLPCQVCIVLKGEGG